MLDDDEKNFRPTLKEVWSFEQEETVEVVVGNVLIFDSGLSDGPLTFVDLKTRAVLKQ